MYGLQAALEIQVELSKFYNVDLFQRGYYQVRTSLKTAPKAPCKVEVSLPKNSECNLIFPASIINGVAVSKTFQILYRNEDVSINDVVVFKVYMLVDSQRIEESIEEADFQVGLELWFTDEEFGPDQQEKLNCISQRSLKLHFTPSKGLHHHVPVLFDYFHLSVICVSVHATLLALHQPYINLSRPQPKSAWTNKTEHPTMESVLFGSGPSPLFTDENMKLYGKSSFFLDPMQQKQNLPHVSSPRIQQACNVHRTLCHILLSAYESLQTSYQTLMAKLPPHQQIQIESIDCHQRLQALQHKVLSTVDEEDLFQVIQSDIAQVCAQNVILWTQYLELVTLSERITHQLAKEHHLLRVKRFAEGFFTVELNKQQATACFEPSVHGHSDLHTLVRSSQYFQNIPVLPVECTEIDGDANSLPIIFEDIYCEISPTKQFHTSEDGSEVEEGKAVLRRKSSRASDNSSSYSGDSSSPKFRRSAKLKFIKNQKPEAFKRPSAIASTEVKGNVAYEQTDCTLVGFRKLDTASLPIERASAYELGTLGPESPSASPADSSPNALFNAVSMPTLLTKGQLSFTNSGSMPELCTSVSNLGTTVPDLVTSAQNGTDSGSDSCLAKSAESVIEVNPQDNATTPTNTCDSGIEPSNQSESQNHSEAVTSDSISVTNQNVSSSPSDSGSGNAIINGVENGYFASSSSGEENASPVDERAQSETRDSGEAGTDYDALAKSLTTALGEPENPKCDGDNNPQPVEHQAEETHSSDIPATSSDQDNNKEPECSENGSAQPPSTDQSGPKPSESADDKSESDSAISSAQSGSEVTLGSDGADGRSGENQGTERPALVPARPGDEEDSSLFLAGQCTILELLQEEWELSEKEKETDEEKEKEKARSNSLIGVERPDGVTMRTGTKVGVAQQFAARPGGAERLSGGLSMSASTPELSALHAIDKSQRLVSPVADKTISFIASKENLRRVLRYNGHLYSDHPSQASSIPYFWPPEVQQGASRDEGIHLIVCVHGLDGNSADLRLVRTYLEMGLPGGRVDFLMSERNQPDTFADFEVMTDRLVGEVLYHIEMYGMNPARISFVGHSLGNLIIRSALSRPQMAPLLPKLYTFLSLSGPHLGTLYNNSGLVNMGMWFMQKWKKSGSLLQLSLKDHPDPRQSFLYKLSQKTGIEFFKNVLLVGSSQDRYVPYHSSRIELCKSAVRDSSGMGAVYSEMVSNILQPILYKSDITFIRYDVFHALQSTANTFIGRAAHIAVLDSELFIEKFITVCGLKYFK